MSSENDSKSVAKTKAFMRYLWPDASTGMIENLYTQVAEAVNVFQKAITEERK